MTKETIKTEKPAYLGHRQRLRDRYLKSGIDALAEHEILELMLFYAIPRTDTKPTAHRLISEFGSLKNVLDASMEALTHQKLTDNTALFLRLFGDVSAWVNKNSVCGEAMTDFDEVGIHLTRELGRDKTERLIILLIDSRNRLICTQTISEGSFQGTDVNTRKIVECCLSSKAEKIILAHNHPAGNLYPSFEDINATNKIKAVVEGIGVCLLEHYIICGDKYAGLLDIEKQKQQELYHSNPKKFDT